MKRQNAEREIAEQLRSWNAELPLAQRVFDWATQEEPHTSETTVDRLMRGAKLTRNEAILALKELARIGCGKFLTGRHGKKSRIRWEYALASIGRAATGIGKLERMAEEKKWEKESTLSDKELEALVGRAVIRGLRALNKPDLKKLLNTL